MAMSSPGVQATLIAAAMFAGHGAAVAERFDTKTASFAITFHGETSAYRDTAVVVMPNATVIFDAVNGPPGDYTATTRSGTLVQQGQRQWKWTAPPRADVYLITFEGPGRNDAIAVHALVPVPAANVRNGILNGYPIGAYPAAPLEGNPLYLPPRGFIEVTKANEETKVSPHFTLKQFVCKEDTTKRYPKYVVLHERLPLKLEMVLERVNELGFSADTLHVMSAYRTPYYNHAIGDVKYSMHQWGSAADVYVDPLHQDRMEDLNRDGVVDIGDAKFLYDEIEELLAKPEHRALQGGMGFYPATAAHPPFVHLDVRGTAARWKG
jgi:uncharacterized protein YcbK (DUF882 family)